MKIEEKILKSTVKLFTSDGVNKVSMDKIAENASVSKMTIYKYFGDKDSMMLSLCRFVYSGYLSKLSDVLGSDIPLKNKMFGFLGTISEFSDSGKYGFCKDLQKINPDTHDEYLFFKNEYKRLLLELITSGKNDGVIFSELSDEYIYHYIDMGVEYYQNNDEYRNKMLHNVDFREGFFDFIIKNIFVSPKGIM